MAGRRYPQRTPHPRVEHQWVQRRSGRAPPAETPAACAPARGAVWRACGPSRARRYGHGQCAAQREAWRRNAFCGQDVLCVPRVPAARGAATRAAGPSFSLWPCGRCGQRAFAALRRASSQRIFSGRGGRASTPCERRRIACGRAGLRAWLPSGACGRASALPWRCVPAAWRRPPGAGRVRGARLWWSARCRSSSSAGLRRAKSASVSHKNPRLATCATYPQNLCISMWTEGPGGDKRAVPPMVCVRVSAISPAARKFAPAHACALF
jgi:hypothetical protein